MAQKLLILYYRAVILNGDYCTIVCELLVCTLCVNGQIDLSLRVSSTCLALMVKPRGVQNIFDSSRLCVVDGSDPSGMQSW